MHSYLDMSNLTDTINSYDKIINEIHNIILSVEKDKENLSKEEWDGKTKENCMETLQEWIIMNIILLSSIVDTRNNLNDFLAQNAESIKTDCEKFVDNFS